MAESSIPHRGVLVTGAGGFIGGTAMEHLISAGEKVIGTDQNVEGDLAKKLHLRRLDNTDKEATRKFVWDNLPDKILHFSGIARPGNVAENEPLGRKVNIDAVLNLTDAIINARKRDRDYQPTVLVTGSVEQFGDPDDKSPQVTEENPITEESSRNPNTPYGRQKEEMAVRFLQECYKEKIRGYVIVQGQLSGVSPSGEISQKTGFLIPDISSQIATMESEGRKQGVLTTGILDNMRPILDVNDAIEVYLELAKQTPITGEYIVCAPKSRPLKDVLEILIRNSSIELIHKIDEAKGSGGPDRFYSPKKVIVATGWNPKIELETTIKRVLEFQRRYSKGN